jgi:hypothetical protein
VLSEARGRAQVFVALYSPSYLATSWPRREQNAFRIRMRGLTPAPESRILPVLWTPVPPWIVEQGDAAQLAGATDLFRHVPEYLDNGLRALCMLRFYDDAYQRVLNHLADLIIELTEASEVSESGPVDLDRVPELPTDDPSFIIALLSTEREPGTTRQWHPYPDQLELPFMAYAFRTAERFGLTPKVVAMDDLPAQSQHNPALAIVDPRVLRGRGAADRLRSYFEQLPSWVRPLVVGDSSIQEVNILARRAQALLESAVPAASPASTRAVERLDGPLDLERRLTLTLAKARHDYLRQGPYGGHHEPTSGQET